MNRRNLYTLERFRPTKPTSGPASGRGAPRRFAPIRPGPEARDKRGSNAEPVEIRRYVDLKKTLKPLRYTIDRLVGRGRIYSLTGPTNAGKTTWCTMAALAVATGRSKILDLGVEKGRVLYLAIENPYDTISRFAIAQRFYRLSDSRLRNQLFIVKTKATPEDVFTALKKLAKSGPFALVIVDTLAAFFDGKDMNDNVEGGNFIRRLRTLTTVLGKPAVLVPAHPIKGADKAKLSPYGGGAIINEVDGNLTLWRRGDACTLHWQTKFRGPDFNPVVFRFRIYRSGEVVDARGRQVPMPLLLPIRRKANEPPALPAPVRALPTPIRALPTAAPAQPRSRHQLPRARGGAAEPRLRDLATDRQRSARSQAATPDTKLLRAMIADPNATQADWARATGVAKSNVNRRLARLQRSGLVHGSRGKWAVTEKGKGTVLAEPK